MRIAVFGAAGNVGSRVVTEALARGHEVTAVVRDPVRFPALHPSAAHRVGDAADAGDVAALSDGHDLVVGATRPAPGNEDGLTMAARGLLAGTGATGVRLLLVGGAGSLTVPGTGGTVRAADDPRFVPPQWRAIARACDKQLAICLHHAPPQADWAYLSPPALLEPGTRTGRYRLGGDELLLDAEGRSAISMEDLAVALVDEAERPEHHRARFTVAY
ncbi:MULTISPECIES: NAD(P)H-binding protein [unclassified Streptomyces]|uniref:NAD(P)-dependent oxidoreductase n=1 Tax=unclassified Streptomyces TaxID=2593676 RepID=UPI002DDA581B|nr:MULTISPECIES: NAD(P)H-binding protein [unclassified Streptomyces]WSA97381.1 NAD(P)H-binding protein [Streptomyces sp. NBC_01795]WSB81810.1 NAD(P)H-binding protein [Streptomyces sp. NBC_01775]WSS17426.1 NAD(P)H-binding protein [Streptomyces sp. NBC_01186]WSS46173.1 NAD(P)H-binding protein [Streptomyces sp. NBC_01187]